MFLVGLKTEAGTAFPIGATPDKNGCNFSIYSKHAEKIVLCLFNAWGYETHHVPLTSKTGDIWHVYVHGIQAGQRYGYRVYGPFNPQAGHRFNPNKLLMDPAAKLLTHPLVFHKSQLAYIPNSEEKDLSFSKTDSADYMPKCLVTSPIAFKKQASTRPNVPWNETIIYETHLKGFTIKNPDVAEAMRGTFAGLSAKKAIDYLKSLGISSIELLPIASFFTTGFLKSKGLSNYWGYDPVCFQAPAPQYLMKRTLQEINTMVQVFHEAGIEVILDVVYNHTGEGSEMGPTLCYRGIDNVSYYRLIPDNLRYYNNDTGTGNAFNLSSAPALQLVMDSLRYWVDVFDIDGFRFDLATTLGRTADGSFSPQADFFKALKQDKTLQKVKLIAEPWDLGWGGYQLGHFPTDFAEWTDKFRDTARRFWKGDNGQAYAMHSEFIGAACREGQVCQPEWKQIKFITAHDGFTLYDVLSYNQKHNEANGEDNHDGNDANWSWNSGTEGSTQNPEILAFRFRRAKAMMASLLLCNGIPMILAGDELLRTQYGNNNAYAQDNKISWFNWDSLHPYADDMHDFVQSLIQMRKDYPLFSHLQFPVPYKEGQPLEEQTLVSLRPDLKPMGPEDWGEAVKTFALWIKNEQASFFVVLNAAEQEITYLLPKVHKKQANWQALLDTAGDATMDQQQLTVGSWSLVVLKI